MALILSIETADKGCSVALHEAGVLLHSKTETDSKSSSSLLTTLISDVFSEIDRNFGDLAAVAVSKGPGSYTGLRIGVSTAKGFCYALDLPLIAINTLDGIVYANRVGNYDVICPMLDARRMEVYCKMLDLAAGKELIETSSIVIEKDTFARILDAKKVLFCGPGANKCKDMIGEHANAFFEKHTTQVQAINMGSLTYEAFKRSDFVDIESFEPFYLKDFIAKKSQKKMPLDNSK